MAPVRRLNATMIGAALLLPSSAALAQAPPPPPVVEPPPSAPAPPPAAAEVREDPSVRERLDALERRLDEQARDMRRLQDREGAARAEIERLRSEAAARRAADAEKARAATARLVLSGYLQVDAALWRESSEDEVDGSTGEPLNQSRFFVRRARLRGEIDERWVMGAIELDGNTVRGPQARLIDAEIAGRIPGPRHGDPPYAMLTLGLFKIPFGLEVQESERASLFLEKSAVMRAFFPGNYDLGVRASGGVSFLRYAIAVMNGAPIGERQFPGRDPNESKDVLGRLGVETKVGRRVGLTAGVSALAGTGFHEGTPTTKDVLVWRDANENGLVEITEIQVIAGTAATPSENFDRSAVGLDAHASVRLPVLGDLTASAELVWGTNLDRGIVPADPVGAGRDLRERGWYVGFTQEVTRWGMIGVRYDHYDPDADATEQRSLQVVPRDQSLSTWAFAAAIRYPPRARLVVEYDRNQNANGRAPSGAPTVLPDDAVTLRGEVVF